MKIHIDLPWGGAFDLENAGLSDKAKDYLFWLAMLLIFGKGVLAFFGMVT